MKPQIYPEMSRKERKEAMKAAAYKVEYEDYQAPLPADELSAENDAYSQRAIELERMEADFTAYKKKKAAEIKAVKEEMAVQLQVIKTGKREVEGSLYLFQDLQTNDMNYFDMNGMWIRSRKIRPEERQTTIFIGNTDVEPAPDDNDIEDAEHVDLNVNPFEDAEEDRQQFIRDIKEDGEPLNISEITEDEQDIDAQAVEAIEAPEEEAKAEPGEREPGTNKNAEVAEKIAEQKKRKSKLTKKQLENEAKIAGFKPTPAPRPEMDELEGDGSGEVLAEINPGEDSQEATDATPEAEDPDNYDLP